MSYIKFVRLALHALLLAMWTPALAMAATMVTMEQTLQGVTLPVVMVVVMLSTLSGATALVLRIDRELRYSPENKLPRPYLFVSAHMLGSWVAGVLAFILGEGQNYNDWLEMALIIVASFLGATFIERVAEKYIVNMSSTLGIDLKATKELRTIGIEPDVSIKEPIKDDGAE